MSWFLNAFSYLELKNANYDGATRCNVEPVSCPVGFTCDEVEARSCFGPTGNDILSSLHSQYDVIDASDEVAFDCAVLLAVASLFKLIHCIGVRRQCLLCSLQSPVKFSV